MFDNEEIALDKSVAIVKEDLYNQDTDDEELPNSV